MVVDPEELLQRELMSGLGSSAFCDAFYSQQRPMFSIGSCVWNPPADVYETEDALVVKIEVAGVDKKNLSIAVNDGVLLVRGVRRDVDQPAQTRLHHVEVRYGQFERSFALPPHLDTEAIRADYEGGFLVIRAPKKDLPSRTIQVDSP